MADTHEDLDAFTNMANQLNLLHNKPDTLYTKEKVREWVFGETPAFNARLVLIRDTYIGYVTFNDFFNSDAAGRGLWIGDLYIREDHQGRGYGRRLLAYMAAEAERRRALSIWWGVLSENIRARQFYASLDAKDEDARILELEGAPLRRLAAEFHTG